MYVQPTPVLPPFHPSFSIFLSLTILSIRRICPRSGGHLGLPLITIRQQLLLVVQQLLPRLGGVLGIR